MNWIFQNSTRVFELFSTLLLWGLGLSFLIDDRMLQFHAYSGFPGKWWVVSGMLALAAISSFCLSKHGAPSRFCAGFVMLLAALGWAIISAQFFKAWPPLTTAMVVYPCLSGFCFLVGFKNIHDSRAIENAELDNG